MIASAASGCGVRVAMLGLANPVKVSDEGVDYEAIVGIYVVTRDGAGRLSRDEASIAAVETIMILCDRTRWGLPFCKIGERPPSAQNLYNAKALADGMALWAIDLRQPVRLAPPAAAEGGALSALWLGISPNIGTNHAADYVQVAPEPAGE